MLTTLTSVEDNWVKNSRSCFSVSVKYLKKIRPEEEAIKWKLFLCWDMLLKRKRANCQKITEKLLYFSLSFNLLWKTLDVKMWQPLENLRFMVLVMLDAVIDNIKC